MRKARARLPEQGTQTPSPAPDLIPAETKNRRPFANACRPNISVNGDFFPPSSTPKSKIEELPDDQICLPVWENKAL